MERRTRIDQWGAATNPLVRMPHLERVKASMALLPIDRPQ